MLASFIVLLGYVGYLVRGLSDFAVRGVWSDWKFRWDWFYYAHIYRHIERCWRVEVESAPRSTIRCEGRECVNFGSYNYLGTGGTSPSPTNESRASLHRRVEREMCAFLGAEHCVATSSGYLTNWSVLSTLVDTAEGDVLVLSDALNHTSIRQALSACVERRPRVRAFAHNSVESLCEQYYKEKGEQYAHVLVVVEGLYSMEGDYPPLHDLVAFKHAHSNVFLYVDEAHSIGALGRTGRGVCEYFGVPHCEVDFLMGTFTKSMSSMGGYVAFASRHVGERVERAMRERYGVLWMHGPCAQQVLDVVAWLRADEGRAGARLRHNALALRRALRRYGLRVLGNEDSPVVPVSTPHIGSIAHIHRTLLERGVAVVTVAYPATPLMEGVRLRLCASSSHTRAQIERVAHEVAEVVLRRTLPLLACERAKPREWSTRPSLEVEVEEPRECSEKQYASALARYGCGSCGPRGFYGTYDVHVRLERALAAHHGAEECVVYPSDRCILLGLLQTLSSTYGATRVALECTPGTHEHRAARRYAGTPANVFVTTQESTKRDVLTVYDARQRAFGERHHAPLLLGSFEAVGGVGGYCVGPSRYVNPQRLYAKSYVFSASLPPYQCELVLQALKRLAMKK